jgi:hypothetical protein
MSSSKYLNMKKFPDYLIFLPVPVVYLILLLFVDDYGKFGICLVIISTLVLLTFRYLRKKVYFSSSSFMNRATITYFLIIFAGNILIFNSLFESVYLAIVISLAVLTSNMISLNSRKLFPISMPTNEDNIV